MMRTLLPAAMALALFLMTSVDLLSAHPPHVTRYIETYFEIAIQEMHRSGIPASVILAQGIHESSWGLGKLSTNSNNHFGIKCKSIWNGPTYYIEDDDYQNGRLVKSCFRVYNSVKESYIDHTNFLVEGTRYESLFGFHKTDYRNWSKGLKRCGYATDPDYASKLIKTIEKYGLNKYDLAMQPTPKILAAPVFNLPASPTFSSELINNQPEILVPSTVLDLVLPSTVKEEDIPAAVSIENYFRRQPSNESNNSSSSFFIEEPLLKEESEWFEEEEEISTEVLRPPSYQLTPPPSTAVQTQIEQPEKHSIRSMNDRNLLLMRGKTRVKKTLRQ